MCGKRSYDIKSRILSCFDFAFHRIFRLSFTMSMRPDDHRRKWDRDEYQKKAVDRVRDEKTKKKAKYESDDDEDGKGEP